MKRYTKEFITEQIKKYKASKNVYDVEIYRELAKILWYCERGAITDFEAVAETVATVEKHEGRKADEEAERAFNEYEAEYGADGAAWRRRGGSAW